MERAKFFDCLDTNRCFPDPVLHRAKYVYGPNLRPFPCNQEELEMGNRWIFPTVVIAKVKSHQSFLSSKRRGEPFTPDDHRTLTSRTDHRLAQLRVIRKSSRYALTSALLDRFDSLWREVSCLRFLYDESLE